MASRKPVRQIRKRGGAGLRTGLRSGKASANAAVEWQPLSEEEENPEGDLVSGEAQAKSSPKQPRVTSAGPAEEPSMMSLVQEFLRVQRLRDEDMLEEFRGMRAALQPGVDGGVVGAASESSPRLHLPTPAARRGKLPSSSSGDPSGLENMLAPQGRDSLDPARIARRKEPKMPLYQQGEDIENYLLRFERMARTWHWPEDEWACRLVPLLTGKALEAYTAMDEGLSGH